MKLRLVVVLAVLLSLVGVSFGMSFNANTDLMLKNGDGEYVKLFGPGNFYYNSGLFPNPITYCNGEMRIGNYGSYCPTNHT